MSDDRFYWGRFNFIRGIKSSEWLEEPMTKAQMLAFDDTFRHRCKAIPEPPNCDKHERG